MTKKTTLTLFYTGIAAFCIAIVSVSFYLRSKLPKPDMKIIVDSGKEVVEDWGEISEDLEAINQEGLQVRLSDLKGKVWLVAEFFAVCPHCMRRNGEELQQIYQEFGSNPDFHIVCISVDPENDKVERLEQYGSVLNADPANWWFLNAGDNETTHRYLEKVLKFFAVKERTDPMDIETNGRYAHDLSFLLVDRNFKVVGKWPLADLRTEQGRALYPGRYEAEKKQLFDRIRAELALDPNPSE